VFHVRSAKIVNTPAPLSDGQTGERLFF